MTCIGQPSNSTFPTPHHSPTSAKQPPHWSIAAKLFSASLVPSIWTSALSESHLVVSFTLFHFCPPYLHPRHSLITLSYFLVLWFSGSVPISPAEWNCLPCSLCTPSLQPRAHTQQVLGTLMADKHSTGSPGSGRSRPPRHQ